MIASILQRTAARFGFVPQAELRAQQDRTLEMQAIATHFAEQASGVKISMGHYDYELNARLKGPKRWEAYAEMETDPRVHGVVQSKVLPLVGAPWKIIPASDKAKAKDEAEFVAANYLCQQSDKYGRQFFCATSWRQRLGEKLRMLTDGFAMANRTTRLVSGKRVYDHLHWLEPSSVDVHGWEIDDYDNIIEIRRTFRTPTGKSHWNKPLKPLQVSLDVWDLRGARYEGTPFIRSLWGAYFRKDQFVRYAVAWAQKVASGVPVVWWPPNASPETKAAMIELAKQMRGMAHTESFFAGPMSEDGKPGEVGYATSEIGEIDRMGNMIKRENDEMGLGGGDVTSSLPSSDTGNRALGQVISEVEIMQLGAISTAICEFANTGLANLEGDIPLLHRLNFASSDPPMLECTEIFPQRKLAHVPNIIAAVAAGIIPVTPEFRQQFTEMHGFKLAPESYEIKPAPVATGSGDEDPDEDEGNQPDDEEPTPEDEKELETEYVSAAIPPAEARARIEPLLAPDQEGKPAPGMRRRPNKLEARYVNLAAVQQSFDAGQREAWSVLRSARAAMVAEITRRIVSGKIDPRNIESQRQSKPPGFNRETKKNKYTERLRDALAAVAAEGQGHVLEELGRMGKAERVAA